ncbi:hypothetical protein VE01_05936 [Pseudogymnoascus verrucosus]|uniref:Uncharacterized protein n=1 Tax=Pseudogymnoascus verrucosus TaxID=342668 RepID=A0A1B8GID1_9PEZI|nr:uncharacterized protein VE01_05936 [Pseudogymnoascus verrucosus]OBT95590.1 hypothetical protein VE01_05936 [Pseudogymnoascus verrucosus]
MAEQPTSAASPKSLPPNTPTLRWGMYAVVLERAVREFNLTTRGEHFLQYMSKALFGMETNYDEYTVQANAKAYKSRALHPGRDRLRQAKHVVKAIVEKSFVATAGAVSVRAVTAAMVAMRK